MKRSLYFWAGAILFLLATLVMTQVIGNEYPFFAAYVILQFIVLAVAWSILGGYAGYVNFGTSAFSASASIPPCSWSSSRARRSACRSWPPPRSARCSDLHSAC
jgi:hypothetical protein